MEALKDKRVMIVLAAIVVLGYIAYSAGWFGGGAPEGEAPAEQETTTQ
jgi:hypothetical protein